MDDSESSPPPSALEDVTRSRRGADQHRSHRSSKDHERTYISGTAREIARLLRFEEREANDLRKMLYTVTEQLKSETQRADAAEMQAQETARRFKSVNEAKVAAEQEASRANEELQLYKLELERARRELHKAKELLDTVETQRIEAEESAARARSNARKWKEQRLIEIAKEEGRRQGIEEGLARGQRLGYEEGRYASFPRGRTSASRAYPDVGTGDSGSSEDNVEEDTEPSPPDPPPPREPPQPTRQARPASNHRMSFPEPITFPVPAPAEPSVRKSTTPPSEPPTREQIRPIIVHNAMGPSPHPPVEVLPDGYIPKQDQDRRIRIPPQHEMGRMPSPPPPVVSRRVSTESIPLMIPPPSAPVQPDSAMSDTEGSTLR